MESIMVMRNHVIDFTPTWFFWYLFATWSVWLCYAEDKEAAEEQQRLRAQGRNEYRYRTPEKDLLTVTLISPIGAWLAMYISRHKVSKQKFWNGLYCSIFLHFCLYIYAKGEEWI
uniref:DUF1294 domain-containing protein n=1 Tax=Cacopsylla melanoneura TaxID=428564 RepID=A0A8D8RFW4_9HEMI